MSVAFNVDRLVVLASWIAPILLAVPKAHRVTARDGFPPFFSGSKPSFCQPQFQGLNASLWAPNFPLPTVENHVKGVLEHSWMGDLDITEMFLNFCLHEEVQSLCGVDLRGYFPEEATQGKTLWERWVRCMMGLKTSPYVTIKGLLIALEVAQGNPLEDGNPMGWKQVKLNLPGSPKYDPSYPRIWRYKKESSTIAPLLLSYVDDLRVTGESREQCWSTMHRVCTRLSYLGIQMALRKFRPPSQDPGAWAGSLVSTNGNGVAVRNSQDKWTEIQQIIRDLRQKVENQEPLNLKELQSVRGTITYEERTYPMIMPYLKGFHLTIDSWQPGRDPDGWLRRYTGEISLSDEEQSESEEDGEGTFTNASETVKGVPRFRDDLISRGTV
jgi:hypothetical protein